MPRCLLFLLLAGLLCLWQPANGAQAQGEPAPGICSSWVAVNEGAFGLPSGASYASEEGFEVLVYQGRLYVGMEADNTLGARLWRTRAGVAVARSQADWEEVIADAGGCPFGNCTAENGLMQNDHIDSLAEFDGYLYASTANGGATRQGAQVWRSPSGDPGAWTQANSDGFGDLNNTNFKDMQVFEGWLCGGTQNGQVGAQVWCTQDGAAWVQKNVTAFADLNVGIWSGHVYDGALYFGAHNLGADPQTASDDVAKLYRTFDLSPTPSAWEEVFSGPEGSHRVEILGDMDGYLYISHRSSQGIVILRSPSGDAGAWQQVNQAGMDGNPDMARAVVDSATTFGGALYVAISDARTPAITPVELWRTTGSALDGGPLLDWMQVGSGGLGDANHVFAQLIPFNGFLYAWTSNYASGQRVVRADCDPVQHDQNHALRFYGHGVDGIDRVKIAIDDPETAADVGGDFTLEWWMRASLAENDSGPCTPGGDNWISGNILFDRALYGDIDVAHGDYGVSLHGGVIALYGDIHVAHGDYGVSLHGGVIAFGVAVGASRADICGSTQVADGQWRHVAVTRDGGDGALAIYVDGQLDASRPGPTGDLSYRDGRSGSPNDPFLVIGAEKHDYDPVAYPSYSGYLDEVRLSAVVRYTAAFTPPGAPFLSDAHTVALYHFDEGSGDVLHDVSGAAGGPSPGIRHFGGDGEPGPAWVVSDAPLGGPPPAAVTPAPTLLIAANDARLEWAHDRRNARYRVWRSATPYFAPGDSASRLLAEVLGPLAAGQALFQDAGALNQPGAPWFYRLQAVNAASEASAPSPELGLFVFALAPGA